jgi:glycosyltransferase involved in cell wall biosynthesis
MRIVAIVPYHLDFCAGQRFRIELWAKELARRGIEVEFLPFTNENLTDTLYQQGKVAKKAALMFKAFATQLKNALTTTKPDLVFVYREAAIAGPAIIEKIVRRWNVPMVYDIDEPLFVPYKSPSNGYLNKLKFFSKVDALFRMSDSVFAVNNAIADYAGKFNDDVHVVPMTVDLDRYKPSASPKTGHEKPIIVWVGTNTNQPNVEVVVPALRRLREMHDFKLRIIADYEQKFDGIEVEFIKWSFDDEVRLLQESDIGIIPVAKSPWSPWKFFFKTVQFLSVGLPVVGSATGSNLEIIEDGKNGFLAETEQDWYDKLLLLLEDAEIRREFGASGRKCAVERFNIERQYDFLEKQFKKLCENWKKKT